MFGWEFPPYISGGLGTACYGITKGLSVFPDINLTFVIPNAQKYGSQNRIRLIGASDVELSKEKIALQRKLEKLKSSELFSRISSYITPEQYEKLIKEKHLKSSITSSPCGRLNISGEYGTSLYTEISRYATVAGEIAKQEPHDIIHAHDWLTFKAGVEAKKASGKPLVVHVHATELDRSGENCNPKVFNIEKRGMQLADKVITVSNLTRNTVINRYGILPQKVITVHNAVEPLQKDYIKKFLKIGINERVVTFLGRITYQKGPEYFIATACEVLKKMNNVRFVMAGSGDLSEKMIKYVASLGISDKFHFTGFLRGDDVYRMYAISDLYVMPSISEPFGISPLEALQSDVPIIISKQSGVSEVINHAIKLDFWDTHAMADAIYGILNYSALANVLKSKGKQEVISMKWTDTADKIRKVYYDLAYCNVS